MPVTPPASCGQRQRREPPARLRFLASHGGIEGAVLKELGLLTDWTRPLHAVILVDDARGEERVKTVYEPREDEWTDDFRRRRR